MKKFFPRASRACRIAQVIRHTPRFDPHEITHATASQGTLRFAEKPVGPKRAPARAPAGTFHESGVADRAGPLV